MNHYISGDSEGFLQEEFEDIMVCLETLLAIREGSQPVDRDFGINYEKVVGYPLDVAKNMLSLEIIEKVESYEPRVEVDSIQFTGNADGQLRPHIHFIKRRGTVGECFRKLSGNKFY